MSERVKILLLLGFIFVAAGGFLFYLFVWEPLAEREKSLTDLRDAVEEKTLAVDAIQGKLPLLREMEKRSLPSKNIEDSRRLYQEQLSDMLRNSFDMDEVTVRAEPATAAGVPELARNMPAYTTLTYRVDVNEARTPDVIKFLEEFYTTNLLHQISHITVAKKASTRERGNSESASDSRTVEVNMTVEAIILDKAEKRMTLMPETPLPPMERLAPSDREYVRIIARDPFFGAPAAPAPRETFVERDPPPFDATPYMKLTDTWFSGRRTPEHETALAAVGGSGAVALLNYSYCAAKVFDSSNNHHYTIATTFDPFGTVTTRVYKYDKDEDQYTESNFFVATRDGKQTYYYFVRVDPLELILAERELRPVRDARGLIAGAAAERLLPPKLYRWHIGDNFADMTPVPPDEARHILSVPAGVPIGLAARAGR